MDEWKEGYCKSITLTIYIGGDLRTITETCREYCTENPFCVSIKPCDFAYKYGLESGAEITLINYPRFPRNWDELYEKAEQLGYKIADRASQGSFTIQSEKETVMYDRRGTI